MYGSKLEEVADRDLLIVMVYEMAMRTGGKKNSRGGTLAKMVKERLDELKAILGKSSKATTK